MWGAWVGVGGYGDCSGGGSLSWCSEHGLGNGSAVSARLVECCNFAGTGVKLARA